MRVNAAHVKRPWSIRPAGRSHMDKYDTNNIQEQLVAIAEQRREAAS
jgi:hypothetical protein